MRKIQIAISPDLYIRLTWNLTGSCGQQQRLRGWSCTVVKQFQDGGRYIAISQRKIIRFRRNFVHGRLQQIFNWMNVTWSKMKKLHWTDSDFDRTYFLSNIISQQRSTYYGDNPATEPAATILKNHQVRSSQQVTSNRNTASCYTSWLWRYIYRM